jgi:hypothetical protein
MAKRLNIKTMEDWYGVRTSTLNKDERSFLQTCYDSSLVKALSTLYPQYPWIVWKFPKVPQVQSQTLSIDILQEILG